MLSVVIYFIFELVTSCRCSTLINLSNNPASFKVWPPICHTGKRQSPINLPQIPIPEAVIPNVQFHRYKHSFFRMKNNGYNVQVDFVGKSGHNEGPSSYPFYFPDPLDFKIWRQYKFSSAHFHWGSNDYVSGSEHCIAGKCGTFEIHFVHYLANYSSLDAAISSGNENAITVLAALLDVSATKTAGNNIFSVVFQTHSMPKFLDGCLGQIVKRFGSIGNAHQQQFLVVPEQLDFTNCFMSGKEPLVYSYKGSLTTPGCEEQVNWFVLKSPSTTSHQNLDAFRNLFKDNLGRPIRDNHRPLQALNGRKVRFFMVNKP